MLFKVVSVINFFKKHYLTSKKKYKPLFLPYVSGHLTENANASVNAGASGQVNYANGSYIGQQTADDLKYHGTELVMLYDYKVWFKLK